ncbi:MAG: RHS repeat-associated core domain-containing protein [Niveispirillum sp.]|uniref:RHS repeat-associated core domain-containing protein n=1 Tax=Niveispirillum sp. TaxID=1917217 RepID=UPI003BA585C8
MAVHAPAAGLIRLLPNRQGSVIGWLRPDGKLGGAYTYDAYGNSPQAGAGGPAFRYAGMRFDAETGLYHTPNRAYDPQDGRWMQLDPIGIKDGLNRYAYVKNSPLMYTDPSGLCPWCIGAALGATFELASQLSKAENRALYGAAFNNLRAGNLGAAFDATKANLGKIAVAAAVGATGASAVQAFSKAALSSSAALGSEMAIGAAAGAVQNAANAGIDGKSAGDIAQSAAIGATVGAVGAATGAFIGSKVGEVVSDRVMVGTANATTQGAKDLASAQAKAAGERIGATAGAVGGGTVSSSIQAGVECTKDSDFPR